jgi:hypothetical protein
MAKRTNPNVESVNGGSPAAFIARPEIAASLILKAIGTTWGPLGVVIGQRARGRCRAGMRLMQERPPGAVVRAWCPKRSEEDVLWVRVAAAA